MYAHKGLQPTSYSPASWQTTSPFSEICRSTNLPLKARRTLAGTFGMHILSPLTTTNVYYCCTFDYRRTNWSKAAEDPSSIRSCWITTSCPLQNCKWRSKTDCKYIRSCNETTFLISCDRELRRTTAFVKETQSQIIVTGNSQPAQYTVFTCHQTIFASLVRVISITPRWDIVVGISAVILLVGHVKVLM